MSSFAPGFAMTHAELASATLDAIKARAVALESPLSEEDVGILDSMNMSYYGCNVRDADEGTLLGRRKSRGPSFARWPRNS